MTKMPFDYLPLRAGRSTRKPRRTGLTMMIDMGLGPEQLRDRLRVIGPYVDVAKIFVGSARLYDEAVFREKQAIYAEHRVDLFIGGQFVEYLFHEYGWDGIPPFLAEVDRLGVQAIEISDNCITLSDEERRRMIRMGIDAGLEVHGEVGSKQDKANADELVAQARLCLEAGSDRVLVEAAELVVDGDVDAALIERLKAEFDPAQLMIELPGPWIKHVTLNDVFEMQKYVIRSFGPDVSLGNVMPDTVLSLEALRCGIGIAGPE